MLDTDLACSLCLTAFSWHHLGPGSHTLIAQKVHSWRFLWVLCNNQGPLREFLSNNPALHVSRNAKKRFIWAAGVFNWMQEASNYFNSSNPFKSSMHLITIDNPNHFSASLHGRHDGFQLCLMQRLRNEGSWQRKEGSTNRMVYSQQDGKFWKSSPVAGYSRI